MASIISRSPPAEKARPAPVITETATSASASTADLGELSMEPLVGRVEHLWAIDGDYEHLLSAFESQMLEGLERHHQLSSAAAASMAECSINGCTSPNSASDFSGCFDSVSSLGAPGVVNT